jgi:hypothetical protein
MNVRLTPPPVREFPETRLKQRREQLLSQIQAEDHQPLRQPRRGRRWALALGSVTAVAAVAIAVVALLPAGGGGPNTAAAAVLDRLARLIAAQPLTPQPGQYLYIRSSSEWGAYLGNCDIRALDHGQIWIGANGSGLMRDTFEPGHFTSRADRATCLHMARKEGQGPELRHLLALGTSNDWFAPRCLSLKPNNDVDWSNLSSDPQVLLTQMLRFDGGQPTPAEEFTAVGDFLRKTDAPPAVRATIYRAAALIPGVRLLGTVRVHDSRPGLGLAYTSNPQGTSTLPGGVPPPKYTSELIFDPRTGELLGEQQTGADAGWAVYLREKVVNGLPGKPPAPLKPPCTKQGEGFGHHVPGGSITTGAPATSP